MLDAPLDTPVVPATRDWRDRPLFVASHRAQGICLREVQRISDEIASRLRARHAAGELSALVVSQAPGRCVAQVGPVALTIAWLRGAGDVVADGQLMVAVWEGAVAHGTRRIPERAAVPRAATARTLWEETYSVVAEDEASWRWHVADDVADLPSMAVVDRCLDRLMLAHADRADGVAA
jgi:hypothetical protein